MSDHKNTMKIVVAVILFIYAALISVVPAFKTKTFNINAFQKKVYDSTSLVTTIGAIEYKVKPNLEVIINIRDWSSKYIDKQPVLDAGYIEIHTTLSSLFSNNFDIKSMNLRNVVYADQILPNGKNKLAFLPSGFNSKHFGTNKITIKPGKVHVHNFKITYVTLHTYDEKSYIDITYQKDEVKKFLKSFNYSHVVIK